MKHSFSFVAFVLTVTLFVSCKKGDDGAPGTANVKYSAWFTPNTYQKDTIFGIWGFNYIKDAPPITQRDLDSGTVLVFAKLLGYNPAVWKSGEVGQLPINITYMQGGVTTDTWSARATVGNLRIRFVNDRNIYNVIANQHQFRYIIIPGGVPAGRGISLAYEDVCRMYGIPE